MRGVTETSGVHPTSGLALPGFEWHRGSFGVTPVKGALAEPARNFAALKRSSFLDVLAGWTCWPEGPSGLLDLTHDDVFIIHGST
jgi:hypothetical protein